MRRQFQLERPPGHAWTAAQQIVRALHNVGMSDKTIATVINCHPVTVNKIRNGRVSVVGQPDLRCRRSIVA
jgi:hypothetical protein